jgi:penicillin amidase
VGFSQLGGDKSLSQFAASMKLVTTLHNFLYADRLGNIAFFGDGLVPVEPSFSVLDPRLPALGNGTEQWLGYVPWSKMPRSINPAQGYLDNWNTKPSESQYYQQNSGDEYWGTIFRSSQISTMLASNNSITVSNLESIEHSIGQIDNDDNTRPAASYFIPFLEAAYKGLVTARNPLVSASTHPDLATAMRVLASWNDTETLGSPAMSIFMNTLEALERNVCEGGVNSDETYVGAIDMSDAALGMGTYGGLGGDCTYNFLYHVLAHTQGVVPCGELCYQGSYFSGDQDEILLESVNDAISILSGTGTQLGQNVPGFGTTDVAKWGYKPAQDTNWSDLDPFAAGYTVDCGTSASQNRSTFMMAVNVGPTTLTGYDELPPGQSGFLGADGVPSPHLCDQVTLFNTFRYKAMPPT